MEKTPGLHSEQPNISEAKSLSEIKEVTANSEKGETIEDPPDNMKTLSLIGLLIESKATTFLS